MSSRFWHLDAPYKPLCRRTAWMNAPSLLGAIALGSSANGSIRPTLSRAGLDLLHVQADEIRVRAGSMVAWMGLAMMVSTRLWLAGVVSQTRDTQLADRLLKQVRACCHAGRELLICTDGWSAYVRRFGIRWIAL